MPGMNGFERAQQIKARHPLIPIALATAYAELPPPDPIKFDHLFKPHTSFSSATI
jgi:CheY-like chemotaxis protein